MTVVECWQQNGLYFSAKQTQPNRWLVWCSFEPLTAKSPAYERPEQDNWFEFDRTKEGAIEKLLKRLANTY